MSKIWGIIWSFTLLQRYRLIGARAWKMDGNAKFFLQSMNISDNSGRVRAFRRRRRWEEIEGVVSLKK